MTTQDELGAQLKTLGIRLTPQRLAIAEVVVNSGDHPSVKEIYGRVKEFFPYVTLATVYSTLTVLENAGIVRELPFQKQSRYDANLSPHATLVFALVVTVGLNADTGVIADTISKDQTTREAIVAAAENGSEAATDVSELGIPFGWFTDDKFTPYSGDQNWYGKAIGLFLTTIAVSLGAQFWFDAVGRLIGLKSGGKPKRTDETEAGTAPA